MYPALATSHLSSTDHTVHFLVTRVTVVNAAFPSRFQGPWGQRPCLLAHQHQQGAYLVQLQVFNKYLMSEEMNRHQWKKIGGFHDHLAGTHMCVFEYMSTCVFFFNIGRKSQHRFWFIHTFLNDKELLQATAGQVSPQLPTQQMGKDTHWPHSIAIC